MGWADARTNGTCPNDFFQAGILFVPQRQAANVVRYLGMLAHLQVQRLRQKFFDQTQML